MNAFDLVERHHGLQQICHAIRHLLDHTVDEMDSGDVDAIDILQLAINPLDSNPRPGYQVEGQIAEVSHLRVPTFGEDPVQTHNGDEPDLTNPLVGEILPDCPSVEQIRRQHPVSLLSLFELLLHAVHYRVLGRRAVPSGHHSPLGSAH